MTIARRAPGAAEWRIAFRDMGLPQSYYALRDEDDGSWSVIDLTRDEPAVVRERSLVGLNKQEAYDAIRLLAIIEQLRRSARPNADGPGKAQND